MQNASRPATIALAYIEAERPSEWLRHLCESPSGYAELLAESGELAVAAYRLARARCRTQEVSMKTPTSREVHAAALEILRGLGDRETLVPPRSRVAAECAAVGLVVMGR